MKIFVVLSLVAFAVHSAEAVTHSLQYFFTGSSGIKEFPEFVAVGIVDGQPFVHYDSNIKRCSPKQEWMEKNEGSDYWDSETQKSIANEQTFKGNIEIAKQRFNQTGGVHLVQRMYGCEWDDVTGDTTGSERFGYDGEDFIALDLKTESYIAPSPQAVITKNRWDQDKARMAHYKNYFTQECPEWLKKYVDYGRSSLMRTELPSISLLQKSSSSPITCHATGFYPNAAEIFWRKDGEEVHEGVDKGEILSNQDGTFQMSVQLKAPSEDWTKYQCVFQLSGKKDDIIHPLEKAKIRTNESNTNLILLIVGIAAVVILIAVAAGLLYKFRANNRTSSGGSVSSDEGSEAEKKMLPQA